mmetsp:Transcript_8053/g.18830  ORF Transcript_8053/g.18830 Transcript_8053/m.18830 type:complete len:216 (-) Transcript_8053:69-716(-)
MLSAPVGASRLQLKAKGRIKATDELRDRCLARIREARASRLMALRSVSGAPCLDLSDTVREAMEEELQQSAMVTCQTDIEIDHLIALETELMAAIQQEESNRYVDDFAEAEVLEHEAICDLYEQHMNPGLPCPVCGRGRVQLNYGDLRCTSCGMDVAMMDEAICLDEISERLWMAEAHHREAGCCARAGFEVLHNGDHAALYYTCPACGWEEMAL